VLLSAADPSWRQMTDENSMPSPGGAKYRLVLFYKKKPDKPLGSGPLKKALSEIVLHLASPTSS